MRVYVLTLTLHPPAYHVTLITPLDASTSVPLLIGIGYTQDAAREDATRTLARMINEVRQLEVSP